MIELNDLNIENAKELFTRVYGTSEENDAALKRMMKVISYELTEKEISFISYRFGFDNGTLRTIKEASKKFNISLERYRQVESRIIKKLLHPHNLNYVLELPEEEKSDVLINADTVLESLNLSSRTIKRLKSQGICTVGNLIGSEAFDLYFMKIIGGQGINEIINFFISNLETLIRIDN